MWKVPFWGPFFTLSAKYWTNELCPFLALIKSYIHAKKLEKTNGPILRKSVSGKSDRQDKHRRFYSTFVL